MKKFYFFVASLFIVATAISQETVYTASDAAAFGEWSIVDADEDGFNWGLTDVTAFDATWSSQGEVMVSYSYDNATGPLTPDNWAVSPAIDLTGFMNAELSWGRTAIDADWVAENYSVYVVSAADATAALAALPTATAVYTETIENGEWVVRTADISGFDNTENVFVAIRHHDCTDMFAFIVDDITVTGTVNEGGSVALAELEMTVSAYPNPANSELNIKLSETAVSVAVISMDGKVVASQNVTGTSTTINVSNLNAGVYFYEVKTANGLVVRNTFVKK